LGEGAPPLGGAAVSAAGVILPVAFEEALPRRRPVRLDLEGPLAAGQAELVQVLAAPPGPPGRAAARPEALRGVLADDVDAVARLRAHLRPVDPLVAVPFRHGAPSLSDGLDGGELDALDLLLQVGAGTLQPPVAAEGGQLAVDLAQLGGGGGRLGQALHVG